MRLDFFSGLGWRGSTAAPAFTNNYLAAVTTDTGNAATVRVWNFVNDWGRSYSSPASISSASASGVAVNPNKTAVFMVSSALPKIHAWRFTGNGSGFGTKYSSPATTPSSTFVPALGFNDNGSTVFINEVPGAATSVIPAAYSWTDVSGFGTRFATSVTVSAVAGTSRIGWQTGRVAFGNAAAGSSQAPFIFPWTDGVGFGTRWANPATGATAATRYVQWRNTTNGGPILSSGTGTLEAWNTTTTAYGTKFTAPQISTSGAQGNATFTSDGTWILYGDTGPRISSINWSNGFGFNRASGPSTQVLGPPDQISLGPVGGTTAHIAVGLSSGTGSRVKVYAWSPGVIGVQRADPANMPTASVTSNDVRFG